MAPSVIIITITINNNNNNNTIKTNNNNNTNSMTSACNRHFKILYVHLSMAASRDWIRVCIICKTPEIRKEGMVLFNDALNTFDLRLYGVRHMVKDHSESERGNLLPPHGLPFPVSSKDSFICTIPQTR